MENKQKTFTFTQVKTFDQQINELYELLDAYSKVQSILPIEMNRLIAITHSKIQELEERKDEKRNEILEEMRRATWGEQ